MNQRIEDIAAEIGKLALRVSISVMMLTHGWPKLTHFSERAPTFSDPLHVGSTNSLALTIFAEVFCAILAALGFAARLSSAILVFTMLVAGLVVHGGDPWAKQEKALLFAAAYLAVVLIGPGRYCVDARIARRPFVP